MAAQQVPAERVDQQHAVAAGRRQAEHVDLAVDAQRGQDGRQQVSERRLAVTG
jgi:hypothetical protein